MSGRLIMDCRLFLAALLSSVSVYAAATPSPSPDSAESCGQVGQWLKPAGERPSPYPAPSLLGQLSAQQVVLLGETHDRADDHRWQLDVLTALQRQRKNVAIGFEMFPRRLQPVLDRWVAGELSEAAFLEQAEWKKVWGYDAELYLPLFRFAREHRLPMLALNVDRKLVQQVSASGWDAVAESERQGVSRPTPPGEAYRAILKEVFDSHAGLQKDAGRFDYFVDAQILWDRAMAEGIAAHLQRRPQDLVVGILGAGHIQNGYGVPHQLASLGVTRQSSLMTWPSDHSCKALTAGLADAVFVIPPQPQQPASPPPRLGVHLQMADDGVRIEGVMQGSLAEQTGLKAGDIVVQAAGRKPGDIQDMIRMVQRQPAGTWLPLQIRRGTETLEMVVRFPAEK
ncbi:MAG: ChaN family lipoprotein [Thiobacillus sp.]